MRFRATPRTTPDDLPEPIDVDQAPRVLTARAGVHEAAATLDASRAATVTAEEAARTARRTLEDVELQAALAELDGQPVDRHGVAEAEKVYAQATRAVREAERRVEAAGRRHAEALAAVEPVELEALQALHTALDAHVRHRAGRLREHLEAAAGESAALEALAHQAEIAFPPHGPRGQLRRRLGLPVHGGWPWFAWAELREPDRGPHVQVFNPTRLSSWREAVDAYLDPTAAPRAKVMRELARLGL
jgi:hypothetical protein